MFARRIALALVALTLGIGATACGEDDDAGTTTTEQTTTDETTTEETTTRAAGREIFVGNCGSCHSLADAGTTGVVGPDLDELSLDVSAVEAQVRSGGGGMPAFQDELTDEEIRAVATYVVEASRS